MKTDAVVCARNEEDTIMAVIRALYSCRGIGRVFVVDDQSGDATGTYAALAGAEVITGPGQGKAAAMLTGLRHVQTARVLFCDADIRGLTPGHVGRLLSGPDDGMMTGIRGDMPSPGPLPPLSGERCLPAELARRALADARGFEAELAIDAEAGRAQIPVTTVRMAGVTNPRRMPHTELVLTGFRYWPGLLAYAWMWLLTALGRWLRLTPVPAASLAR